MQEGALLRLLKFIKNKNERNENLLNHFMKNLFFLLAILVSTTLFGQITKTTFKTIGGKTVFHIESKNVFMVTAGLMIDADGSPRAYHENNNLALDYLDNAGKPGNWWALVTDSCKKNGNPIVQTATDPAPGYYVSTTSLQDTSKDCKDPNRYVNSETIPYIALPPGFSEDFKLGDIALVVNKKNNKKSFAIFADTGPKDKIGEGSIYLAEKLGIKNSPKNGGTDSNIVYILIKKSGKNKVLTEAEIEGLGKAKLTHADIEELLK
jgi:hypothetical protein